jgi:hypothetical protein
LVDVVATKLKFIQQPTTTAPNATMTPAVTVEATDTNNNRDIDYATAVTITSTGSLSESPVTGVLSLGIATFSSLVHTSSGTNFQLTASSGVYNVISNSFNIESLMLIENMDYSNSSTLTSNGWTVHSTGINPITVSTGSISYSGYLSSEIGNEISLSSGGGEDINRLITPRSSGVIYTSFILNVTSATTSGDYFFCVGQTTIGTTFRGRIFVKRDASSKIAFGISQSTTSANYTGYLYDLNTSYLIVLKYEIFSGTTNDKSSIYVNPILNTTEPASGWYTNTDASGSDLSEVGTIGLRQGGSTTAAGLKLDGIRVSTSWADIVGTEQIFTGTGNWTETARWNSGSVPATTSAATIDGSATVSSAVSVSEIKINATRSLTVANNGQLTVSGAVTNNAGLTGLVIKSDASGTGSLLHNSASVNATIERYITGSTSLTANMYHFVSVPLEASNNPQAGLFTGSYLSYFDQPTQGYLSASGSGVSTPLDVTRGYMIYYPNTSTTYSFAGTMNNGSFTANTSHYSVFIDPDTYTGFNLVPNPYPSAIDWNAASGWTKTLINDAIWIWNPTAGNYAAYGTQAGTNNGTRYIPQGQSFFVQSSNTSPVLAMNNSVRVHNAQAFYKSAEASLPELLRIKVDCEAGTSDEIIVRFNSTASIEKGLYDVAKLTGSETAPQLYTLTASNDQLSINALPHSAQTIVVPVGIEYPESNSLTFTASGIESFESSVNIFLEDKLLNKTIDLRENPVYNFTNAAGADPMRFSLLFYGVNSTNELNSANYNIWANNDKINILVPEMMGQKASVQLIDQQGRILNTQSVTLDSPTVVNAPVSSGLYIVRVVSGNQAFTSKVFIR